MKDLFTDLDLETKTQKEGKYDKRNALNDLTGKEWLKLTSSFWVSEKCKLDKEALKHPAPFLVKDIEKLIRLFTKKDMVVLDPFCGSGTTLIASFLQNRFGIGYDLSKEYYELALSRLKNLNAKEKQDFCYEIGNNIALIQNLQESSVDYIVTSPPYFNILKNKSQGLRADKSYKGFRNGARSGVVAYDTDTKENLENCKNYGDFLLSLEQVFIECKRVLKDKKYLSIIISDFTVNKIETNVTGNIIDLMIKIGYEFVGNIALLQPNKPLYPFGYPYAYKINHHNQNILNFKIN
ncbi:DNA methyltransferase [Helicobacter sp. T3_23-1059]